MPRPRTWTDRQLADAVASAKTWVEVAHKLGSTSASPTTRHLRQHAKRLRLDTRHLPARTVVLPSTGSPPPLNEDAVVAAVTTSGRWIDVLGKLQVSRSSASYRRVQRIACVAGVSLLGSVPEQDTFPE